MHCMLEQIEATEEERIPPSEEKPPPRQDGLHPEMASILGNMAMKLALNDKEREVSTWQEDRKREGERERERERERGAR